MDLHILDRALQESCYDIDATIKSLSELHLAENRVSTCSAENIPQDQIKPIPEDGTTEYWVELVIGEMMTCTSVEDARAKAAEVLKGFEKSTGARIEKENMVLKRAVCLLLKRRKELEGGRQEVRQLKEMVAHQQEQLRTLETTNYVLNLHLKQALQCNSKLVPAGSFNPDVF